MERIRPERFVHPENDLHRRKLRALDNFIEGLLSQPERHQLGRIILALAEALLERLIQLEQEQEPES